MKILWITALFPCRKSGSSVREFYLIKHLCRSHSITVLTLIKPTELQELDALRELGVEVIAVTEPPSKILSKWPNRFFSWFQLIFDPFPNFTKTYPIQELQKLLSGLIDEKKPDILHFDHLFVAPLINNINSNLPIVLTEHNIENQLTERLSRQKLKFTHRLGLWIEARKLRAYEMKTLQKCHACICVSRIDSEELQRFVPETPIFVVPNGVDTQYFDPSNKLTDQRRDLLFFGNLGYPPNFEAILYFCHEIFPLIKKEQPGLSLNIVGPNAPNSIMALQANPGINFIGYVEDIRPYLWQAAICVVPLLSGGGTRLKILEAMAAQLPVVSTHIGAEGLQITHEKNILIADTPRQFAESVLRLYHQPDVAQKIALNGHILAKESYDWESISTQLESVFQSLLKK